MPDARPHARQRRPEPTVRGWCTSREYAEHYGFARSTVRRWCLQGAVPDRTGARVPVEGGDGRGRDYHIPLHALA